MTRRQGNKGDIYQFLIPFGVHGEQTVDANATGRESAAGRSPVKQQMTNNQQQTTNNKQQMTIPSQYRIPLN